jgi:hypothetical protein
MAQAASGLCDSPLPTHACLISRIRTCICWLKMHAPWFLLLEEMGLVFRYFVRSCGTCHARIESPGY